MVHELQRLRRLHILLVDDDPGAVQLIRGSDRLPSDLAAFPLMED